MASDVSIQRYPTKKPVVVIPCSIAQDMRLSLAERGFFLYLESQEVGWEASIKEMADQNNVSEKTIQKYLKAIQKLGYINPFINDIRHTVPSQKKEAL